MTKAWRLTKTAAAHELNGEENREKGGRWNSPGSRVVYCSSSLALAALECWIHLGREEREHPEPMCAVLLAYPDDAPVETVRREDLPDDLGSPCSESLCRKAGDDWIRRREALVLIAPSFVVPHEVNVMMNADHPAIREVQVLSVEDFRFDPRMARPDG